MVIRAIARVWLDDMGAEQERPVAFSIAALVGPELVDRQPKRYRRLGWWWRFGLGRRHRRPGLETELARGARPCIRIVGFALKVHSVGFADHRIAAYAEHGANLAGSEIMP